MRDRKGQRKKYRKIRKRQRQRKRRKQKKRWIEKDKDGLKEKKIEGMRGKDQYDRKRYRGDERER